MIIPDVNILVSAHRASHQHHKEAKNWLSEALIGKERIGIWDVSLISAFRIITNSRIFADPSPANTALHYLDQVRNAPASRRIESGPKFWGHFLDAVELKPVSGTDASDAMLVALAFEYDATIATFDRDFSGYAGLRTFRP